MDDIYLVEVRLARTHWKVKGLIESLADFFGVRDSMEQHPHVTLFGPFTLNDGVSPEQLLDLIGQCAASYDTLPFMISDWERRDGLHGGVIAFSVVPSVALRDVTWAIAGALNPLSDTFNHWDGTPEKKWFHVTVANRLHRKKASEIITALKLTAVQSPSGGGLASGLWGRITRSLYRVMHRVPVPAVRPLLLDETGLRVTVMRGQEVFAEYDLLQKRWIRGGELHDIKSWKKTLSDYRRHSGFELAKPVRQASEGVCLLADLHLGHANIIRYCSRPFVVSSVDEMDRVLIQNWNATIPPAGRAYLLGDLRYGRDALPSARYRDQLNGDITFIQGNHDTGDLDAIPSATIVHENRTFLLIHNPDDAPDTFDGWIIHGHHHNNDLRHYPFMDFQNHRINVSAEVVGYSPVGIQELLRIIEEHEKSGDTAPLLLRYRYTF